jgi:hypothetical protein
MPTKGKRAELIENIRNFSYKYLWDEMAWVLENHYGFRKPKKQPRGSPTVFIKGSVRLVLHKPHGRGDRYIAKQGRIEVIKALEQAEAEEELNAGHSEGTPS